MTLLIDARTLQNYLKSKGHYHGPLDGKIGPLSQAAARELVASRSIPGHDKWGASRILVAAQQLFLLDHKIDTGKIDGLVGPQTRYAVEEWIRKSRDLEIPEHVIAHQPTVWPRQKDVPSFYGEMDKNQVMLKLPYPMKLAWDKKKIITEISIHAKVAESAKRALTRIHEHYGPAKPPGIDLFGGCLNVRKMRGGNSWSMHSWGIAIDFDPDYNQLSWGANKARLAKPIYEPFWQAWEAEGWISLGRERNYDWMHVQAARL